MTATLRSSDEGRTDLGVNTEIGRPSPVLPANWRPSPVLVAVLVLCALFGYLDARPVSDLDSYWHVAIGRQMTDWLDLFRNGAAGYGTDWLAVAPPSWSSSEWLSERGMATLVDTWDWRALVVTKVLVLLTVLVTLAAVLFHRHQRFIAAGVWLLVAACITPLAEDRPQTLSMLFLVLLGWVCVRTWDARRSPPLLAVGLGSLLWAQLHGMWLIAPLALGATTVGVALDALWHRTPQNRQLAVRTGVAALVSLVGLVNPLGLSSLLLPLRFRDAGNVISEWHPTTLYLPHTIAWAVVIVLAVAGWVIGPRPCLAELVYVATWGVFGATTLRNALLALLLLAPVPVASLHRAVGERWERNVRPSGPRERRLLAAAAAAAAVAAIVVPMVQVSRIDPLEQAAAAPLGRALSLRPAPVRVLNDYNTSGQLVAFGGGKVRVVIDGRFDMWGKAGVDRISNIQQLRGDWRQDLKDLNVTAMVIASGSPLAQLVQREGTWHMTQYSHQWVLLEPVAPSTTP
jgi:hypothetical protein